MRFLRLGIGLWGLTEAFRSSEWILLLPAGILLMQAAFNVGCMGAACAPAQQPQAAKQNVDNEPVSFEEIR